jgi:hypothetical protein
VALHLSRSSASGHLLKAADGHLVAAGECNCCNPAVPDTLCVTLAGLGGDLAAFNGTRELWHESLCTWRNSSAHPRVLILQWIAPGTSDWRLTIYTSNYCAKSWLSGGQDPCDPTGTYGEASCSDDTCANPATCEASAGATCVVSYS